MNAQPENDKLYRQEILNSFIKDCAQGEPNAGLSDVSINCNLKVFNFGLVWSLMGCVVEKEQFGGGE